MITYPFDKIMKLLKMSNTLLKWAIRLLVVGIITTLSSQALMVLIGVAILVTSLLLFLTSHWVHIKAMRMSSQYYSELD